MVTSGQSWKSSTKSQREAGAQGMGSRGKKFFRERSGESISGSGIFFGLKEKKALW